MGRGINNPITIAMAGRIGSAASAAVARSIAQWQTLSCMICFTRAISICGSFRFWLKFLRSFGAPWARRFGHRVRMILRLTPYIVITFGLLAVIRAPAYAQAVAVFDFELINTSLEGATNGLRADEQARLGRLSGQLRQRLTESGRFSLVDITPIASEARASNLQACGGCDSRLAKRVGAELAITGTVQKVSNLILNMNIYIRDVSSERTIAAMSADMRGNTDESWSRTLDWLIRNRLLTPGYGARQ
jgi:hypothetical protein